MLAVSLASKDPGQDLDPVGDEYLLTEVDLSELDSSVPEDDLDLDNLPQKLNQESTKSEKRHTGRSEANALKQFMFIVQGM